MSVDEFFMRALQQENTQLRKQLAKAERDKNILFEKIAGMNKIADTTRTQMADLRTRLEEAEKERDEWKQIAVDNEFKADCFDRVQTENASLKQTIEKAREETAHYQNYFFVQRILKILDGVKKSPD